MIQAVNIVINENRSVRQTALDFNIPRKAFGIFVTKHKSRANDNKNENKTNL